MGLFDDLTKNLGSLTGSQSGKGGSMGGLLGSAAVGGLLGALLGGSKGLQRTARNAAVVGAGAGAAALAYSLYQKWRNGAQETNSATTGSATFGTAATSSSTFSSVAPVSSNYDDKALLLIEAMVFAARADGHIDQQEQALIEKSLQQFSADTNLSAAVSSCMQKPLDPEDLARRVSSAEEGADVYFLSALIVTQDTFMEKSYLNGLAGALGFDQQQKAELDARAEKARQDLLR